MELVLIATILVIGLIVGLTSLRNQVVEELTDVGQGIGRLSQSFCFGGTHKTGVGFTDGTCFRDLVDFCESTQTAGEEPGGISVRMFPFGTPSHPPGGELTTAFSHDHL